MHDAGCPARAAQKPLDPDQFSREDHLRNSVLSLAFGIAALATIDIAAAQQRAVCYNCPPEWADWGSQLKAIKAKLGLEVPPDNKNSGQAMSALIAEKAKPVADVTYLGGNFGDAA